jgi:hypothetical protein
MRVQAVQKRKLVRADKWCVAVANTKNNGAAGSGYKCKNNLGMCTLRCARECKCSAGALHVVVQDLLHAAGAA